jgi:hypothetical protein
MSGVRGEVRPVACAVRLPAGAERPPAAHHRPPTVQTAPRRVEQVPLVDLLDRLLPGGAVVGVDLVICVVGVDLVRVPLHALITTVRNRMAGLEMVRTADTMETEETWPEME